MSFKATLDTRNFNRAFNEYTTFSKRLPADVINAKLYYIALNATSTTKHSSKEQIESELKGSSTTYPGVELAAIIVNSQLAKKGKKGLSGDKMARAIEKLIKARVRSINFIRSGWKNSVKILEEYLRSSGELNWVRRGAGSVRKDAETLRKRVPPSFGGARPARINGGSKAVGEINNDVSGDGHPMLAGIKQEGLQAAIDRETSSMNDYIAKKVNPRHEIFSK